ncbi:MAG: zinc ABC transporter substrate-binding protein [Muribaculaceae bacterium]|nr:zinc ABC transporter substrate-binding protein [Muribaculaceae bacterium]
MIIRNSKQQVWQILGGLLLLLFSLCEVACGGRDTGRKVIAVSFESQKWIVEQIVGDDYEVVALLPPGSDPELFDPDMRTMRALERAQLYLTTNTLGFETQVGERIRANYPDLEVIDISEGIEVLMHTHGVAGASRHGHLHEDRHDEGEDGHKHGHDSHPVGDPHVLSSLRNVGIVADNVLAAVRQLSPESTARYARNHALLEGRLLKMQTTTDSLLTVSGAGGCSFVVMHPSLSYYARDYGMTQIPLEIDGKEATPRQLEERLHAAEESSPRALFFEEGHSARQAREIARSLGIEAYPVRLNGSDFLQGIDNVTRALARQTEN